MEKNVLDALRVTIKKMYSNFDEYDYMEIRLYEEEFKFLHWINLSSEEKHKLRKASLSLNSRGADDTNNDIFTYGKKLVLVYDLIQELIYSIEKDFLNRSELSSVDLTRFWLILKTEKRRINLDAKGDCHIKPEIIQNITKKIRGHFDKELLERFLSEYELMYNLWVQVKH